MRKAILAGLAVSTATFILGFCAYWQGVADGTRQRAAREENITVDAWRAGYISGMRETGHIVIERKNLL